MIHTTVHRPELTAEERARRMEAIKQAAIKLVLETEKAKRRKNKNTKGVGFITSATGPSICRPFQSKIAQMLSSL